MYFFFFFMRIVFSTKTALVFSLKHYYYYYYYYFEIHQYICYCTRRDVHKIVQLVRTLVCVRVIHFSVRVVKYMKLIIIVILYSDLGSIRNTFQIRFLSSKVLKYFLKVFCVQVFRIFFSSSVLF